MAEAKKFGLAGVMGWPVSHSRSPVLHNYWLRHYGLNGAYVLLPVDPARLPAAIAGLPALGFAGFADPISTSCVDHEGGSKAKIHTWDGSKWIVGNDTYEADQQIIKPMIKASAAKYATEKKLAARDCAKELASAK